MSKKATITTSEPDDFDEYLFVDENDKENPLSWKEMKDRMDKEDWKKSFFSEGDENIKDYMKGDKPNYHKIYKDFLDIGSNGSYSKRKRSDKEDDIPDEEKALLEKGKSMPEGGAKMVSQDDIDKRISDDDDDFEGSLAAWLKKHPKGRDDIPVTVVR